MLNAIFESLCVDNMRFWALSRGQHFEAKSYAKALKLKDWSKHLLVPSIGVKPPNI